MHLIISSPEWSPRLLQAGWAFPLVFKAHFYLYVVITNRRNEKWGSRENDLGAWQSCRIINICSRKSNTESRALLYNCVCFTGVSHLSLELMIGAVTYTYVKGSYGMYIILFLNKSSDPYIKVFQYQTLNICKLHLDAVLQVFIGHSKEKGKAFFHLEV